MSSFFSKDENWAIGLAVAFLALWIAGIVGWVLNIVAIANADFAHVTGMLVLRIIGVFLPPIGSVLGLFF